MRFPRPRSSSKSASSSSVSISGTISVVGSVKNTLKAKLSKTKSGKYSQKIFNRRGGCSAAKEAAVAEKDLPKLADLVEERREDAACGNGPTKIDMTCGRDATDANVEARDGPPEDDDDKEEPVVTTTTTTEVGGKQHPSTPTSPSIFGFHTVPSISPAPKNLPNVPETSTAKALPLISPAHSATTALSIHSQQVEMCPKERKGPNEDDEIESEDETLAGEGIEEENGDASKIDIVFTKNEKEAAAVDMPTSTVRDETKQEAGASGLIYITPSVLAASSTNCELSTKLSMRSTVLVEDASAAGMSTDEDNDATDDEEDEGEDEYESDYDGSLADESAEHVITSPRNKFVSSQNDAKKKRRSKVNEKRLRDGHRRACKYLKNGEFSHALEEFEGILDELMNSLGDSHRRVGSALHNVGIVNIRADNLDDAIDAFEEAIRIRKDVHGPDHHLVADSLLELGIALLSQKDYEDALEIFNDVLEIRQNDLAEEARHGSDEDRIHCVLQVAKALNNIACVYFEYGELSKALKVLEDVLEMQQQAIDELTEGVPGHKQAKLSLATTLCNIGYVHADSDDWDNAIEFLDRAYAIQAKHLPSGSGIAIGTLENLAYANYKEKNLGIALEMYQEIFLDQMELHGQYHLACAETLHNIACIHVRQCEYDEALDQLQMEEEIQLDLLGEKSRRLKKTRAMISEIQYELLKFPSLPEMFNRAMTKGGMKNPVTNKLLCSCGHGEVSELASLGSFQPIKPDITSKMSGHKISYA